MKVASLALIAAVVGGCASAPVTEPALESNQTPAKAERSTPAISRSFHDFRPSRDGFAFANHFEGSPLPINLGAAERGLGLPDKYGLCGGMAFAAADYYLARTAIPDDTAPPAHDTPLYRYLYTRQAASVGPMGIAGLKFLEWMRLPDDGSDGARARTAAELPAIRAALDRGEPVVLGLVLTTAHEHAVPWNVNHQVLAYAVAGGHGQASSLARGETADIRIYDPNFPRRDDAVIRIVEQDGVLSLARIVPGRRDLPIRGMFRMAYAPAAPPELTSPSPAGTSSPRPAGSPGR